MYGSSQTYKTKSVFIFMVVNLLFKSLTSIIGYGSVLSQFTLQCLRIYMSKDRNMIVVEQFIT